VWAYIHVMNCEPKRKGKDGFCLCPPKAPKTTPWDLELS